MSLLNDLKSFSPIHEYAFGHTPLQMEYFQTGSQQGSHEFMYWQHVLQLQTLYRTLRDFAIKQGELKSEISEIEKTWIRVGKKWKEKLRSLPRLKFDLDNLNLSCAQKEREAAFHYEIIKTKFSDLIGKTEAELFKSENEYWTMRLGRQLFASHLARTLGVGEGDLSAVLSLPEPMQKTIIKLLQDQKVRLAPADTPNLIAGEPRD